MQMECLGDTEDAVVLDKKTDKYRIALDWAVKYRNTSLNCEVYHGPKFLWREKCGMAASFIGDRRQS